MPDGDIIALFAHDLRNPLAAIVANLSYLRSAIEGSEPEARSALADAEIACAALERMTKNLALVGKASAQARSQRRPTSLREAAGGAAARAQRAATLSRVQIELVSREASDVLVDPDLLGLALDNLLSNSIQHSPSGHKVAVEVSSEAGRASVTILDDGPVVPDDLREVVLRADGQRLAKSRVDGRYGLGLSLHCASEAARLAGAKLAVAQRGGLCAFEISAVTAEL